MSVTTEERTVTSSSFHRTSWWRRWSPAQFVSSVIGVFFLVLGGIVLARAGFNDFTGETVEVLGMSHTALLGTVEAIFGLSLVAAGTLPGADNSGIWFFGVTGLAFGVMLAAAPASMEVFGVESSVNGWVFIVASALLLVTAMASPTITERHVE